jgi:5'-nucleotidase
MTTKRVLFALCCLVLLAKPAIGQTIRVLVTNDDGIGAPGIAAVVDELQLNPNLIVDIVAPATNQSGTGDAFTTTPLGVAAGTTATGDAGTAVSGKPADAVMWGLFSGMLPAPDIVVSGINAGQNIGRFTAEDLSGTVGAASVAARRGFPAIAASLGLGGSDYSQAAKYVANVVEDFRTKPRLKKKMTSKTGLDQRLLLNINFPVCNTGSIRGIAVVPLTETQDIVGRVVTGYMLTGPNTYQPQFSSTNAFAVDCTSTLEKPTSDIEAFTNGFVSVTPMNPTLAPDSKVKKFKFLAKIPFN